MMRRNTATILILILAMATMISGCGGSSKPYDFDLSEYVKVGDYKGIEYDTIKVEITEKQIDEKIEEVLQKYSDQTELKEGTVKNGDYVKLSYSLEMDGKKVDSVSAENYTMQVGEGVILEDIDKALVGKKVGETFKVDTTFPEDYDINPEMAGKEGVFEITVSTKYKIDYPEFNDEFVSKNLDYPTVEEYKAALKDSMYQEELESAKYEKGEEIWNKIVESSEVIQYPEEEVKQTKQELVNNFKSLCEQYGMTFETALESILKTDEESFMKEMEESAKSTVKQEMILYYIARENDLELSDEEYDQYLNSVLESNDMTEEEFKKQYSMDLRTYAEQSGIDTSLLYERVFYFLVDNGTAV